MHWAAYALGRVTGFEIRKDQLKPLDWLGLRFYDDLSQFDRDPCQYRR
jgi:hypothetical protein